MLRFLFWNTARNAVSRIVADLALQNQSDFVLLAECEMSPAQLLQFLNRDQPIYHYAPTNYERVVRFVRFSPRLMHTLFDGPNLVISSVTLPAREEFLLAAAHLPSRLHEDPMSLNMECEEIAKIIREYEVEAEHERTIVIGDLNLNPFEPAIAGASGFHAVMSRRVAADKSRQVHGRRYPFFYNPMWNHFGDEDPPSGTYYYRAGGHLSYFWNIFDQVLVRPDLVEYLPSRPVKILTSAKEQSLVGRNETPDRVRLSDHLPILFTINL